MTIEQCYAEMGGNFAEVCGRLPSQRLVEKFVTKFPDDPSYPQLCQAIADGNHEDAFRAAHTLKGVAGNLSLTRLRDSASALTELLRTPGTDIPPEAASMLEMVTRDYELTVGAIKKLG